MQRLDALLERDRLSPRSRSHGCRASPVGCTFRKKTPVGRPSTAPRAAMSPGTSTGWRIPTTPPPPAILLDVGHSVTNAMLESGFNTKSKLQSRVPADRRKIAHGLPQGRCPHVRMATRDQITVLRPSPFRTNHRRNAKNLPTGCFIEPTSPSEPPSGTTWNPCCHSSWRWKDSTMGTRLFANLWPGIVWR